MADGLKCNFESVLCEAVLSKNCLISLVNRSLYEALYGRTPPLLGVLEAAPAAVEDDRTEVKSARLFFAMRGKLDEQAAAGIFYAALNNKINHPQRSHCSQDQLRGTTLNSFFTAAPLTIQPRNQFLCPLCVPST